MIGTKNVFGRKDIIKDKFVIGVQYCRMPTPPKNEWKDDLKHILDIGLSTIHVHVQWRWIERKQGKFTFEDMDYLVELCEKYRLNLVPNFVPDETIPSWVIQKHPEARVIGLRFGQVIEPIPDRCTMIGKWPICWDHQRVWELQKIFIRKVVNRYKKSPYLVCWDIWNEPTMPTCICKNTLAKYRLWLQREFGKIEEFNSFYGKAYGSFEEVEAPAEQDTAENLCFTRFGTQNFAQIIRERAELIRSLDTSHLIHTHGGSISTTVDWLPYYLNNDWFIASQVDFYGLSHQISGAGFMDKSRINEYARFCLALDTTRSISRYFWLTEFNSGDRRFGMTPYSTLTPLEKTPGDMSPASPSSKVLPEDLRSWFWCAITHGAKGILFWQFKPERFGPEAPGHGLIDMDGKENKRTRVVRQDIKLLKKLEKWLVLSHPEKAQVAIYFDPDIAALTRSLYFFYYQAMVGAYLGLWAQNLSIDIVTPQTISKGYKMIYLPVPLFMTAETAKRLKSIAASGTYLVAEAGLSAYLDNTWYSPLVPGHGLHRLFGIEERENWPANSEKITARGKVIGLCSNYIRELELLNANALATLKDGRPIVTKSKTAPAIYVGTYPSYQIYRQPGKKNVSFFGYILDYLKIRPSMSTNTKTFEINVGVLENGKEKMVVVFNNVEQSRKVDIRFKWNLQSVSPLYGPKPSLVDSNKVRTQIKGRDLNIFLIRTK